MNSTKVKIISTAGEIFSKKGFAGASIREISNQCGVNVAAINYHFESKEKLFLQVVSDNYYFLENEIFKIHSSGCSQEEFFLKVFRMFLKNSTMFLNTYKLFLNDLVIPDVNFLLSSKGTFGPPGIDFATEIVKNNNPQLDEDRVFFVVKNIFSVMCHSALAMSCPLIKDKISQAKGYKKAEQEKNLTRLLNTLLK